MIEMKVSERQEKGEVPHLMGLNVPLMKEILSAFKRKAGARRSTISFSCEAISILSFILYISRYMKRNQPGA